MADKTKTDKVFNEGERVVLSGNREIRVREIPWRVVRNHARDVWNIFLAIKKANPDYDWSQPNLEGVFDILMSEMMTAVGGLSEIAEHIMAEASGLTTDEVGDLSLSDFATLARAALRAQGPPIKDFIELGAEAKKMFAAEEPAPEPQKKPPKAGSKT